MAKAGPLPGGTLLFCTAGGPGAGGALSRSSLRVPTGRGADASDNGVRHFEKKEVLGREGAGAWRWGH